MEIKKIAYGNRESIDKKSEAVRFVSYVLLEWSESYIRQLPVYLIVDKRCSMKAEEESVLLLGFRFMSLNS